MYSNAAISPIYPIPISYNYNVRKSDYEETVSLTMSTLLIIYWAKRHYRIAWPQLTSILSSCLARLSLFMYTITIMWKTLWRLPTEDGGWSGWGNWSSCSVSCDNGTTTRNRTCDNPLPLFNGTDCVGNDTEIETCFIVDCPSKWAVQIQERFPKPHQLHFKF